VYFRSQELISCPKSDSRPEADTSNWLSRLLMASRLWKSPHTSRRRDYRIIGTNDSAWLCPLNASLGKPPTYYSTGHDGDKMGVF